MDFNKIKTAAENSNLSLNDFTDDLYTLFTMADNKRKIQALGKGLGMNKEHYKWPVNVYYEVLTLLIGDIYPELC